LPDRAGWLPSRPWVSIRLGPALAPGFRREPTGPSLQPLAGEWCSFCKS
jgi:hypothetical protein